PEDAVAVEEAPDSGEGVAEAEVDAAVGAAPHGLPRCPEGRGKFGDGAAGEVGVDKAFQSLEGAAVFLAVPGFAQGAALAGEEVGFDARDLVDGDLDAGPVVAAARPGFVKEAALAVRSGEADQTAIGDGKHGADGAVKIVGDAGSLVDDGEADAAVA